MIDADTVLPEPCLRTRVSDYLVGRYVVGNMATDQLARTPIIFVFDNPPTLGRDYQRSYFWACNQQRAVSTGHTSFPVTFAHFASPQLSSPAATFISIFKPRILVLGNQASTIYIGASVLLYSATKLSTELPLKGISNNGIRHA